MRDRQDISNINEPLSIDRFANENYFTSTLCEVGIAGVMQDDNEQDDDNEDVNNNTEEDLDNPPGISLDPAEARGEISGLPPPENLVELPGVSSPENPVELPGVAPPENEVDYNVVLPLFPSDYDSDNESYYEDEDTYTPTQ